MEGNWLDREKSQIDFFSLKDTYFPSFLRNMFWVTIWYKYIGFSLCPQTFSFPERKFYIPFLLAKTFYPDPDLSFEKKPDPDPTFEKNPKDDQSMIWLTNAEY